LEPSPAMANVADFDHMRPQAGQQLRVVFWRRSAETKARRRNPLFCVETGLSPAVLAVDWLHSLALGLTGYWINAVVHFMYRADIFDVRRRGEALETVTLARLRSSASEWRASEVKAGRERTMPGNLTRGMIGKLGRNTSLQGAEANSFLCFLVLALIPGNRARLNTVAEWQPLESAGEALYAMYALLSEHKGRFPDAAIQD